MSSVVSLSLVIVRCCSVIVTNGHVNIAILSSETVQIPSKSSPPSQKGILTQKGELSKFQKSMLKEYFAKNSHPNNEEKSKIATELGVDVTKVHYWFGNERSRMCKINPNLHYNARAGKTHH